MPRLLHWLDLVAADVRLALRALRSTPAYTVAALLILAASMGATTAIFSIVDAVVLRPLPFDEPDRLVEVGERNTITEDPAFRDRVAPQNFLDWRDRQDVFDKMAAIVDVGVTLIRSDGREPEELPAAQVTADFFPVLRARPILGRTFGADREVDGRAHVAVISYGLWQRRFGGATDVIGRTLHTRLADFEIVAVMPRDFAYTVVPGEGAQVWLPYVVPARERVRGNTYGYYLQVIGRLKDGVSIDQAGARMTAINAELARSWPRWFENRRVIVEPLGNWASAPVRRWMLLLLVAVAVVMLISCINVANLVVLRTSARARELGVRAALGASRAAVSRTLVIESLCLSGAGGVLGAIVAWFGTGMLRDAMPADVPRVAGIAVNLRVLAMTAAVAVVSGTAFGLAPMVHWLRPSAWRALLLRDRSAAAGTRPLRSLLVVAEIALAVVLLVGSGLFVTSFWRVTGIDLGLDHHHLVAVQIRPSMSPQDPTDLIEHNRQLFAATAERVRSLPGVETAALVVGGVPLRGDLSTLDVAIVGRGLPPPDAGDVAFNQVSPEYFAALRVPLLRGRAFTKSDDRNTEPVVIVNSTAAHRYFGNEDPIGQSVRFADTRAALRAGRGDVRTIVGVVADMRQEGPEQPVRSQAFVPFAQSRAAGTTLLVRTRPGVPPLDGIRRAIWQDFPDLSLADLSTLDQYFDGIVAQRRINMLLLSVFGLFGLLIASLGVYGVMAHVVAARRYDIGVRLALGAVPSAMYRSIVGRALLHVSIGGAIGAALAWSGARLVRSFLFDVQPHDASVFAGVLALLAITAFVAASVPARRAARIDPAATLRAE